MKIKVLNVDREVLGEKPCWRVKYEVTELDHPDQQPIFYHLFPAEQVEFMMAAYGLEDPEEIVDMILADPFLDEDPGPALYSGLPVEQLRSEHRARCARGKLKSKLSSRGIENPLEMIRSSIVVRRDVVEEQKKTLAETRQRLVKGKIGG